MINLFRKDKGNPSQLYNIKREMTDLDNDKKNESKSGIDSIYFDAWAVVSLLLSIYVIFLKNQVFGKEGLVRNLLYSIFQYSVVEDLWDFLLENILLGFICSRILRWVQNIKEKKWIRENSVEWIQGKWLHIHDKNNNSVRVGWVDIKQNYDNISAKSMNFDAEKMSVSHKEDETPVNWKINTTEWSYVSAQINDETAKNKLLLQAFYYAEKKDEDGNVKEENNGMHSLMIDLNDSKMHEPVFMHGFFGDVNSLEREKNDNTYLSCGRIWMYRMTKELEEKLYNKDGTFNPQMLNDLICGDVQLEDKTCKEYATKVREVLDSAIDRRNAETELADREE